MARYDNFGALDTPMVDEVDSSFYTMNARLRPDQLQPGQVALSINGRMDLEGAWQPRKGYSSFGPQLQSGSQALVLPFYIRANKVISAASRSTTTVTIDTSTAHGYSTGDQINISDISGVVDPTGNRTITVTDPDTFTFQISGAVGSETYTLGASPATTTPILSGNANLCYGSCRFSDPRNSNNEYIILVQNAAAYAVSLISGSSTTISYPSGITISANVHVMQVFSKVYIFRDGATALEWDGNLSGGLAFTKVANGSYTQPTVFSSPNNATCTAGLVTVTETAHGLSAGDSVLIFDNGSTNLSESYNYAYTIATVPTANTFTFYANVDDFTATSIVLGKPQSAGRGYTKMPAPPWAAYHQRRLIVPFNYTTTGTEGSETVTTRDIKDELIFSETFDANTYDYLQNQFRVTAGTADYLMAFHPFMDDAAIAFNRHSIHLVTGLSGSLSDVTIKEITKEAGLVSRKSVVTIGNQVFFLSDNGVYSADFADLYNLRGAGLPLSEAITPLIKRINSSYASNCVGIFHDNRYWLAIPLDSSTTNNAILIYNVLNKGWESMDTINQSQWDIHNLLVGNSGGVNQLYSISRYGGIHLLDYREDDVDYIAILPGSSASSYPIAGYVTTRQYTMGTPERKKFNSFELQVESTTTNASNATITGVAENLDSDISLGSISSIIGAVLPVSEDTSLRARIGGVRSYGMQMTFTPTAGRPKLRLIKITAAPAFKALTEAQ